MQICVVNRAKDNSLRIYDYYQCERGCHEPGEIYNYEDFYDLLQGSSHVDIFVLGE